jgi:hypothetical protein
MTLSELESHFNEMVKQSTYTSTNQTSIRNKMIKIVQDYCGALPYQYDIYVGCTRGTRFSMTISGVRVSFKVSVKSTGEYVAVSRSRNKLIKGVGRLKVMGVSKSLLFLPQWELDEDKMLVERVGYSSGQNSVSVAYNADEDIKICDMLSRENIDSRINHHKMEVAIVEGLASKYCTKVAYRYFGKDSSIKVFRWGLRKCLPKVMCKELPFRITIAELDKEITRMVKKIYCKEIEKLKESIYN